MNRYRYIYICVYVYVFRCIQAVCDKIRRKEAVHPPLAASLVVSFYGVSTLFGLFNVNFDMSF